MNTAIFERITGVPWDEFRVAWRMYSAQHGAQLRFLSIWFLVSAFILCAISQNFYFYAIDPDGSGSLFPSHSPARGVHSSFSPVILIPLLLPLAGLLFPSRLQDPVPLYQDSVLLVARIRSISLQLTVALICACFLGIWSVDLSMGYDLLEIACIFTALAFALCTLQRFFRHDDGSSRYWKLCYFVWAIVYLSIQIFTWQGHAAVGTGIDSFGMDGGSTLITTWIPPLLILLALMLNQWIARVTFPLCCLATLHFTFIQPNLPDEFIEPMWLVVVELAARPIIGLADHAFYVIVGTIQ